MPRCAERHDKLPYSSDHLWNADIHGLPIGPCVYCGEDYLEYSDRAYKEIENLLPEFYRTKEVLKCQVSPETKESPPR